MVGDGAWAVWIFWLAVAGVFYPYVGYPLCLVVLRRLYGRMHPLRSAQLPSDLPSVSLIIPVHNEAARIEQKIANTLALDYPRHLFQVVFVSDGSTDATVDFIKSRLTSSLQLIELPVRRGKAAALNAGLAHATGQIVVFTDASIALEPGAVRTIVRGFSDPGVGCISGEDRISDRGGEGLYGRYELFLRRLESDVYSIVGASGSFYAQRRELCGQFLEGMAPDFLSVLRTVQQGYRAISDPAAVGEMSSVKDPKQEFDRKVRTLLRGMTALFAFKTLLNPFRYGLFAFELWSHKVLRWTVPFFLLVALLSPLPLLDRTFYLLAFVAQVVFYAGAVAALGNWGNVQHSLPGRVALYFSSVNVAILTAWFRYASGVRQELWTPSRR
jgi:cellulose synthase/poly-beta-1,6-N-acetylglucosamine synthase-like glycosyltransferase